MKKYILFLFCLLLGASMAAGQSKRGIALVIGNSAYVEGALKNPVNDADAISAKFRSLGFDVISKVNTSMEQMGNSIDEFGRKASNYDVAIFYYSGHGIQYEGENYLIPVNARLRSESDIRYYCENLSRVLAKLEESKCRLKILMLDACRTNPFERSWSRAGYSRGLSSMDAPMGTIISYATAPGSTADDGVGQHNSPYTAAFLKLLDKPNYSIVLLYNELCNIVRKNTNNRQNPWSSNSGIDGEFCFNTGHVSRPTGTATSNESAAALYNKGNEYYNKGSYTEAVKYYRQAAEKGYADAQLELGYCYGTGKGIAKDEAEAARWFLKAAEQGNTHAQSNLAYYYSTGIGVTQDYNEAAKWARKAADKGHAVAQARLGYFYFNGQGVAKDDAEAVIWYRKSAEQGNEYGMYNLGLCYQYGYGVPKDLSVAKQWYQKAADKGDSEAKKRLEEIAKEEAETADAAALYNKGNEYYNQSNYTEAVKYYRQAAEKGNADAQLQLGYCYETGKGLAENATEAFKWYRMAAEQGNKIAQSNLSNCYKNGIGTTKDYNEAVKWARKSAEQGYSNGQNRLGNFYYNGQGVEKDYAEAVRWFRKAADQENEYGMYNLGLCYQYGYGVPKDLSVARQWYQKAADKGYSDAKKKLEEIAKEEAETADAAALYNKGNEYYNQSNYTEAVKYYRQAAEKGNASAQCDLGYCYEIGKGLAENDAEAFKWYRKAAEQGNRIAQSNLSNCYKNGIGVAKNYNEAVKWARKSADQGYSRGQNQLGNLYYFGQGVEKDYTEAARWFLKSAEQGNTSGMHNIGLCYQYGYGVPKDLSVARQWYQKAADGGDPDAKKKLEEINKTSM